MWSAVSRTRQGGLPMPCSAWLLPPPRAPPRADIPSVAYSPCSPQDSYQSLGGQAKCQWCPPGQGAYGQGAIACTNCTQGSYSANACEC